ncbi:MAG: prepilin-type N-terminal cleavage/methylation domain-containing protein [Nitrospirae bacterium]|nr:prepilin-type N-terminal cleavage/methylation domain-containing protein [Nitrospirota bacterium]
MKHADGVRWKADSGFTLLELVIAVTILPLIILIIGNGFRLGMNAWEKGEQETVWTQRFRVLSGLLSQQIKSAYPYMMEVEDEKVAVFEGTSDSVMFVTALTDSDFGGFKWVRYSHKEGTLFLKEGLLPDKELDDSIKGDEEVVDTDIKEIKFAYLSLEDNEWKDSWDYGKKLPGAVRVKISYFEPFLITIPMGMAAGEEDKEGEIL